MESIRVLKNSFDHPPSPLPGQEGGENLNLGDTPRPPSEGLRPSALPLFHQPAIARPQIGLVDLLDRVLDRGLVLNADIIISLAGVPLIGINLRAALAGMETMVKYGLMQEWDNRIREAARSDHNVPATATGVLPASVMLPGPEEGAVAWR